MLLVVWAVTFGPQLFQGRIYDAGDWRSDVRCAESSADWWRTHHSRALWNPFVFAGLPAAASLADLRPQYLPAPALDLLESLRHWPVWPPLRLPLAAHLAGMLAAALLVRALWGLGPIGMTWAGAAWGLLPNQLVPFAYGHHAQEVTVALIPVALLLVHASFAAGDRRGAVRAGLGLALVVGLQILAGHPQFAYESLALSALFAVERAWHFGRPARLGFVLAAVVLGVALAAASWAPMLHYGDDSIRGQPGGVALAEVARYSASLRDLLVLFWPGAMGYATPTYWGGLAGTDFPQFVTPLVVALAIVAAAHARRDGPALFLVAAAVAGEVLALGTHLGPAYTFLRGVLPFSARLRVAVATLIIAQLALVLLSARGLERSLSRRGRFALPLAIAAGAGALLLLVAGGAFEQFWLGWAGAVRPELDRLALAIVAGRARVDLVAQLLVLGASAALLAAAAPTRARWIGALLVAVMTVDLAATTLPLLSAATAPARAIAAAPPSSLARAVAARPRTRGLATWADGLVHDNDWTVWRVPFFGGSHGSPPRRWVQAIDSGLIRFPAVQRAFAIRVVADLPADSAVTAAAGYRRLTPAGEAPVLWEVPGALTRAYAVPKVVALGTDSSVAFAMAGGDSFPARVAFTTDAGAGGVYPGSAACTIRWITDAPDTLRLDVDAAGAAFVVVADAWFDGWTATVDGTRTGIHRVNHMLRGVAVPGGRHRILMSYEPPGWRTGCLLSGVAFLLALVLFAATWAGVGRRS